MINHARTLLLNSKGDRDPAPWERYIPVEFAPITLPSYLEGIRKFLVGTGGWWDRTYRVECLLTVLESPRYVAKHTWLDPRTTPPLTEPFMYSEPHASVTRVPSATADVFKGIVYKNTTAVLPVKRTWQITGTNSELFTVQFSGGSTTIKAVYSTAQGGWVVPLAADFELLFSSYGSENDIWNVRAYIKPQNAFAEYPAIVNSMPSEWTAQAFAVTSPDTVGVSEYSRWFNTCVNAEDKVAAIIFAYLLKTTKLLTQA
jgi:hypothetical protein